MEYLGDGEQEIEDLRGEKEGVGLNATGTEIKDGWWDGGELEEWIERRKEEKAKRINLIHAFLPTTISILFYLWYEKEKHGL